MRFKSTNPYALTEHALMCLDIVHVARERNIRTHDDMAASLLDIARSAPVSQEDEAVTKIRNNPLTYRHILENEAEFFEEYFKRRRWDAAYARIRR